MKHVKYFEIVSNYKLFRWVSLSLTMSVLASFMLCVEPVIIYLWTFCLLVIDDYLESKI